jgi:hypothetical protein
MWAACWAGAGKLKLHCRIGALAAASLAIACHQPLWDALPPPQVAVPLARALGYKPSYPEYRSAGGGGGAADSAQGGAGEAEQDGEAAVSS